MDVKIKLIRTVTVVLLVAFFGVGCKQTGSTTIRYFEEQPSADYQLAADSFTTEVAHVTLHKADDPVCDDTKNNCIHVDLEGSSVINIANIPVGEWYIWTGQFADYKSWSGAACGFTVINGETTEHNVILEQGVGTTSCKQVDQGVIVNFLDITGSELPLFNNGTVTLHKTDDRICTDQGGTCIQVGLEGRTSVAIPNVEATNWFIWAGGVSGYKAYAGYPCRFDVTETEVSYQEVRLTEGTGTSICNDL